VLTICLTTLTIRNKYLTILHNTRVFYPQSSMINFTSFHSYLSTTLQTSGIGARSVLLIASDGRLLSHVYSTAEDGERDEVVAAVAAQAFLEYATAAAGALDLPALEFVVLDLEGKRIAAACVDDRFLVCVVCQQEGEGSGGKIRTAVSTLVKALQEPLSQICSSDFSLKESN
jgi:predicted regulator of Ras-like GTPase activity (Roadblock/LC7/MglB family)